MKLKVPGKLERRLLYAPAMDGKSSAKGKFSEERVVHTLAEANLVSSMAVPNPTGDIHRPVLDIDIPAKLVKSTTKGHSHLYFDIDIPWDKYQRMLEAMADAGILEEGYVGAAKSKGYTAVRPPWIKKAKTGKK